jgi:putative ABC transport system permease protein
VSYLGIKRRRDMRRQRWQFLAVLVTIVLGVMLFAASYDAYRNLEASYNDTYDRLAFADMTVTGAGADFVSTAMAIDGVAAVEARRQADTPIRIGDHLLQGRLIGMPRDGQPAINQIDVIDGTYLTSDRPNGVVAEIHLAEEFDLALGDTIDILAGAEWAEAEVVGIAISPEYIWPAESTQNFFPPPGTFGVAFISADALAPLPATAVADQTLVVYEDGANREATDAAVESAALAAGAASTMTRAEQPSNAGLELDLQGFEQLAVMFPALFLLAAGMATFIILTRIVYAQRSQIGTLRASGVSRAILTRHYLSYGFILGVGGAVIGLLLGMAMGWAITGFYTDALGIPDTKRALYWSTPVIGLAFGLAVGLLSAWAPTRAAVNLSPAEAMRGDVPTSKGRPSALERIVPSVRRLPARWLMVIRGIGRNPRRSLSTILGVVLALTLILASWGMIDTVVNVIDRHFNEVAIEDASVLMRVPVGADQVDLVAGTQGVQVAEAVVSVPVTARGPGGSYGTQLEAYRQDTRVHGFGTPDGMLPTEGFVAGRAFEQETGAQPGDVVELSFPTLDTTFSAMLVGFVDEPLGTLVYMERAILDESIATADPPLPPDILAEPSISQIKALFDGDVEREAVIERIEAEAEVAAVIDSRSLYVTIQDFLGFFYVFVGVMLLFGGIMAFALIFNTISVNVAEREGEYATMRANGMSRRRIAELITGENLLLTLLGIIPGLFIGYLVASWFMHSYTSDMFTFDLIMNPITLILSAVAMVIVALLSAWPAIRTVEHLDLATVVRERST